MVDETKIINLINPLLPCPKCGYSDLETSPFQVNRFGDWAIRCGNISCQLNIESSDIELLCEAWNLVER